MSGEFKIYTKTGDKGETSLIGGGRVPKFHLRIESYGTLDELNSFVGYLRDQLDPQETVQVLFTIQERIFSIESLLAVEPGKEINQILPSIEEGDIALLETEIDKMNSFLPELRNFIIPGGHPLVSLCHICRTVCRRSERLVIRLAYKEGVNEIIIRYLNRLSDYFFVLARKIAQDLGIEDVTWHPVKN
jgi:cob(I)alamin adenosyltransferase